MNDKSQPFVDFLAVHNIFLPSTFESCHSGPGGTWMHHDGSWKRNDYVGVDCSLPLKKCSTCIPDDIDFSMQKEDHRPLFAELAWEQATEIQLHRQKRPKLQTDDLDIDRLHAELTQCIPPFDVDVHTHAWSLQSQVLACTTKHRRSQKRPKKKSITTATWELIQHKQQWRKALADHQHIQKQN